MSHKNLKELLIEAKNFPKFLNNRSNYDKIYIKKYDELSLNTTTGPSLNNKELIIEQYAGTPPLVSDPELKWNPGTNRVKVGKEVLGMTEELYWGLAEEATLATEAAAAAAAAQTAAAIVEVAAPQELAPQVAALRYAQDLADETDAKYLQ